MTDEQLIPVFVPALGTVLILAEDRKGKPLTSDEVFRIRGSSPCIMMKAVDAEKLNEARGWDIDPENCWYEWQQLRAEMGRSPAIDPGPKLQNISGSDAEYQKTIQDAHASLDTFRRMIPDDGSPQANAMIKTRLANDRNSAFMWLNSVSRSGTGFVAELFEVPASFPEYHTGDRLRVAEAEVLDWAYNDDGNLSGGFSLRYQRSKLPDAERSSFDEYIGVTKYS